MNKFLLNFRGLRSIIGAPAGALSRTVETGFAAGSRSHKADTSRLEVALQAAKGIVPELSARAKQIAAGKPLPLRTHAPTGAAHGHPAPIRRRHQHFPATRALAEREP